MARTPDVPVADSELSAPRFATLWASLVYLVSTMVLAYPALGGRFLANPLSDQYIAGYAFRNFAAQSLKGGHGFPQWNPFLQGGLPYIAAMHGDIFYPTFLLRMIMPTEMAMSWEFAIHLFLAGLFAFLFLRAWRFGFWASLIGGLAYMLGGSLAGLASPGHDGKLFVSALTPLELLLITRAIRDGRMWAWGALAFTVGMAFLSPHPQLFEYSTLLAGFFALYVAFADHPGFGRLPRNVAIQRLAFAFAAVVVGVLIGAVQFWPALVEYKPWSPRAGGHDWATATSFSYPIEEVINWYWPQFTGILQQYWGRNAPYHYHSDYFGVVVLMLAGAAFGQTGQKSFRRFWVIAGVVSLIWAFGGNTPFYHIPMAIVPMTKYLRAPSTIIFITALSVSVLAAIGVERILAGRVSRKYAIGWVIAGAAFGLLMTAGGYSSIASALAATMPGGAEPRDGLIQQNAGAAIIGVWRSFIFVALAAAVLWAFVNDRLKPKATVISLTALLALDLWSIERMYWIFMPPAAQTYATDPAIEAIKADIAKTGPGRVQNLAFGKGVVLEAGRQDRTFSGDHLMIHGLRLVKGYHGNELGMYQQMVDAEDGQVILRPQFWNHENVNYWYTDLDQPTMDTLAAQLKTAPFTKLAGPVRNAVGSMVYAYRVGTDNPYAWVASSIVKAPQPQALGTVLDARFDPRTVAIADTLDKDISGVQLQALPQAAATTAKVSNYGPGVIDVTLDQPATAGQALVVSENYYPGWQATVDGKAAPLGLMNYNLVGVALPAGARSIQLRFTDAAYEKGKRVTLLALLIAVAAWGLGYVMDRRRTTSSTMPVAA